MKLNNKYSFYLLIVALIITTFSACRKEEKLYKLQSYPVGLQSQLLNTNGSFAYSNQIYFSFATQKFYSNEPQWDLAFSTNAADPKVIFNGAHNFNIADGIQKISGIDMNTTVELNKINKLKFDDPNGYIVDNAVGYWYDTISKTDSLLVPEKAIYVLKLDKDSFDTDVKKYIKFKIKQFNKKNNTYKIEWGRLNQTSGFNYTTITCDLSRNFMYLNFNAQGGFSMVNNEIVSNTDWDIVFKRYRQIIPDPFGTGMGPYIVNSAVLLNPKNTSAVELTSKPKWDEVNLNYAKQQTLTNKLNCIGYDYKTYDATAGRYTVDPNRIWILKDQNGNYFKLKFISYYNSSGQAGYPMLAWELLK